MESDCIIKFNGYNFTTQKIPEIVNIALPLHQDSCIRFLTYARHYNDGTFLDLATTKNWAKRYYAKYLDQSHLEGSSSKRRLIPGINYWKRSQNLELTEIQEDARTNFDMDARIEFVYWDANLKCYHIYAFYANCKNSDKAYVFYDIHRAKLLKFISYFNKNTEHLMLEGHKMENRTKTPDYVVSETHNPIVKRNYMEELKKEYPNTKLSDREFETLILFANGCTTKQVAEIMCKGEVTIETHLSHIRKKTGCKDRRDLRIYVREHGWDGLEKFFFSYIPETVH